MADELFKLMILENEKKELEHVLSCNEISSRFGLSLTTEESKALLVERKNNLKFQERIEFEEGIIPKLIFAFCDSQYVEQDEYMATLIRLQDIFYLFKNETLDEVSDDELIEYMKKCFEGVCQGSLSHLEDTCLSTFARDVRFSSNPLLEKGDYDEE